MVRVTKANHQQHLGAFQCVQLQLGLEQHWLPQQHQDHECHYQDGLQHEQQGLQRLYLSGK
jgi:hypothetical protein